ncbi:MAG: efflux RND transporter periplasmic adaptor subunit [Alphaproteobacteria bacterium]|nr:efflux RND transporter periplasmic adaptor subunit [Alphaproteobacteria bacterium]
MKRIIPAIAAALVLSGFPGCEEKKTPQPIAHAVPVGVFEAAKMPVTTSQSYAGFVEAESTVEIVARVPGFITRKHFSGGERVTANQPLFEIEKDQYAAAVKGREATLLKARAGLRQATAEERRSARLLRSGDISQAAYDIVKAQHDAAAATVALAEADLTNARLDLGFATIRSPIDGRVSDSAFSAGNFVSMASGPLTTVVNAQPVYVYFGVSSPGLQRLFSQAGLDIVSSSHDKLRESYTAVIVLGDGTEYPHKGTLTFIDPLVDKSTNTVRMKVRFNNPDGILLPGQFVNIRLVSKKPTSQMVVPTISISFSQAGARVMVVGGDNRIEPRIISTAFEYGRMTVVESGINPGDKVVTEGLGRIAPGALVVIVPAEPPTPPATPAPAATAEDK